MSLHSIQTVEALVAGRALEGPLIAVTGGMTFHVLDTAEGSLAVRALMSFLVVLNRPGGVSAAFPLGSGGRRGVVAIIG